MAVLCLCSGAIFAGCIFSPRKGSGGPPPPPKYLEPIYPENILKNLALAYAAKDSVEYKSLYDSLYTGRSIDQSQPTVETLFFTRAEEFQHIEALARNTTISTVDLQLAPDLERRRYHDLGDPPGWATIDNPVLSFEVNSDTLTTKIFSGPAVTILFKFIPRTPDPSSSTDTTWKIISWTEIYAP